MEMQKLNSANSRSRVFASPYENEAHQELYLNRCPTLQKKKKKVQKKIKTFLRKQF